MDEVRPAADILRNEMAAVTTGTGIADERRNACPVCGLTIQRAISESPNFHRCPACEVIYRNIISLKPPEEAWDENYYSDDSVINYYSRRYSAFREMVSLMTARVRGRRKWLDIGCGLGALLQAAHEQGWEVCGIEPSRLCAKMARERMGYADIIHGPAEDTLSTLKGVSVVSFTDVLRSISFPGRMLATAYRALADGGWVLVREHNADKYRDWRAHEAPGAEVIFSMSLQDWNPHALENTLRLAGFRNIKSIPSPAFTETGAYEHETNASLAQRVKGVLKRGVWPVTRMVHTLSGGRTFLGPNFVTLGQK